MLRNYFKMALKVLVRKKFYTFISMFGISITLAILLIVTAFWEHTTGQQAPEVNLDRSLIVFQMKLKSPNGWQTTDGTSYYFFDRYVKNLKTPETMTFYTVPSSISTYLEGKKVTMDKKYTDASFWEVMKFDFTEGRGYTEEEVSTSQFVAVISQSLKEQVFGNELAVGREIKTAQANYHVIGVVKDVSYSRFHSTGDLYLPLSLDKGYMKNKSYLGRYTATLVAKSPAARKEVQEEYARMMEQVENPDPQKFATVHSHADTYLGAYARTFFGNDESSGVKTLYAILGILAFLFMLLPTVNLININVSRTMERASEIGARKAFGASSAALTGQFVVENMVLTILCGFVAVALAFVGIEAINASEVIEGIDLSMNYEVLFQGFLFTIAFGLLSGVYPAWRMSRLQAAEALKGK